VSSSQVSGGGGTTAALDEVAGLVTRWRRAGGSMDRVRVIASGARTLGSMSADDRRVLAQAVAERGAPEIAERLGAPDGRGPTTSELTELTRALLSVDRAELDGLAASLGDPDERRRLLLAAAGAVASDAEPPPPSGEAVALPPPPATPAEDGPRRPPARTVPEVPPLRESPELSTTPLGAAELGTAELGSAELGSAALGEAALGDAALGDAALDEAALDEATLAAGGADAALERTDPAPAPEPRPAPRPAPETAPRRASTFAAAREPVPVHRPLPTPRPPRTTPSTGDVVDALRDATSARERLLAVAPLEGVPQTGRDLVAVLERLPDGWQRRTAATRLVDGGGLEDVDAGTTLRAFARDSDRFAVAAALLEAGLVAADELAGDLPPRAVERLRRRVARA
jgi:hypothetical protein